LWQGAQTQGCQAMLSMQHSLLLQAGSSNIKGDEKRHDSMKLMEAMKQANRCIECGSELIGYKRKWCASCAPLVQLIQVRYRARMLMRQYRTNNKQTATHKQAGQLRRIYGGKT